MSSRYLHQKITNTCNLLYVILSSYTKNHNYKYDRTISTTSITTRIDSDTMRELQDEADSIGIALSSLTRLILTNYAKWDKFVSKAGMIPVAKAVITEAFDRLSEEEVVQLATSVGKNALGDIILFMKGRIDLDSLFSWLELWLKRNSDAGFSYVIENGVHTCIMKHNLGSKWSLYHKIVLQLMLKEILGESSMVEINIAENILMFKFKECDTAKI
jgi:antitoxin component of RelBE/YafQ-DinJ toxin-antitoxin module